MHSSKLNQRHQDIIISDEILHNLGASGGVMVSKLD